MNMNDMNACFAAKSPYPGSFKYPATICGVDTQQLLGLEPIDGSDQERSE